MSQEMNTVRAADNPELAQQLIAAALSMSSEEGDVTEPVEELTTPSVTLPPSGEVELLAGLYDVFTGEITTHAEIRELNGEDEEALSKIKDYGRGLLSILHRGTVKIGDKPATPEILDSLLSGDREYLIVKIRTATFGSEIELDGACPHCEEPQSFTIDLDKDVKLDRLAEPSVRSFKVDCKVGEVAYELPSGLVQKKLITTADKTSAELDSVLLKECIVSINGSPILDPNQVKKLGMQDRRTILKAIMDNNPGPDLGSISKNCSDCGQEVPIPLTLADIFRL
jgi:hypothetical protein